MLYTLNELLVKLGAPEAKEKGRIRWHYFDRSNGEVGGFAEVRILEGGASIVAEMQHLRRDEDNSGIERESFYMRAIRRGDRYRIMQMSFDGDIYPTPQKAVIELGLSIFHARALDISILMVEQTFNKQDILEPVINTAPQFKGVPASIKSTFKDEAWGVVVPFRPRNQAGLAIR